MELHTIEPVFDENSQVLILGSFPSVKSRETGFFYGHPQNRFWKVIAAVTGEDIPQTIPEKKRLLLKNHIAVWDVVKSCDIEGSSDASIKNVTPNDLSLIPARAVFTNGATSFRLYNKYCRPLTGIEAVRLPSTSPANAACSLEQLCEKWKIIANFL